jgi:hypothetical protein
MRVVISSLLVLVSALPLSAAGPTKNLWQEIHETSDIARLEAIASMKDDAPTRMMHQSAKEFRSQAYARLGAMGTVESLAAADRIEAGAKRWRPYGDGFSEGILPHPGWHIANGVVNTNIRASLEGVTYAVFVDTLFGNEDLLLISSKDPTDRSGWWRLERAAGEEARSVVRRRRPDGVGFVSLRSSRDAIRSSQPGNRRMRPWRTRGRYTVRYES